MDLLGFSRQHSLLDLPQGGSEEVLSWFGDGGAWVGVCGGVACKVSLYSIWIVLFHRLFCREVNWDLLISSDVSALVKILSNKRLLKHAFHHELRVLNTEDAVKQRHVFPSQISLGQL